MVAVVPIAQPDTEQTSLHERLRRWRLVQDELAAQAKAANRAFIVSDDGLE